VTDSFKIAGEIVGEPNLLISLNEECTHLIILVQVKSDEFCALDGLNRVQYGYIELDFGLHDLVVLIYIKLFLFKRLDADEPAQLNCLILQTQEANFGLAIGKTMAYKADELLIEQVDNFLWVLLVGKIGKDDLPIVRSEAFVRQQRVVNYRGLLS